MAETSPRRAPRYPCDRPLRVVMGRSTVLEGWSHDVSTHGVGAVVARPIEPGQTVVLEVPNALGQGSILVNAVVRWKSKNFHGLELVNPTDFQQRILGSLGKQN